MILLVNHMFSIKNKFISFSKLTCFLFIYSKSILLRYFSIYSKTSICLDILLKMKWELLLFFSFETLNLLDIRFIYISSYKVFHFYFIIFISAVFFCYKFSCYFELFTNNFWTNLVSFPFFKSLTIGFYRPIILGANNLYFICPGEKYIAFSNFSGSKSTIGSRINFQQAFLVTIQGFEELKDNKYKSNFSLQKDLKGIEDIDDDIEEYEAIIWDFFYIHLLLNFNSKFKFTKSVVNFGGFIEWFEVERNIEERALLVTSQLIIPLLVISGFIVLSIECCIKEQRSRQIIGHLHRKWLHFFDNLI